MKSVLLSVTLMGLMVGCSTSNNVTSKRSIQKRKYNKGFFVDFNKKLGNSTNEDLVKTDIPLIEENAVIKKDLKKELLYVKEVEVYNNPTIVLQEQQNKSEFENKITPISNQSEEIKWEKRSRADLKQIHSLRKEMKTVVKKTKKLQKSSSTSDDDDAILYYLLAIFIPFVAVGLVTDWDVKQVVINILLCCLCGLPGIIHALVVVSRNV